MSEFFLELFTEEMPPSLQNNAKIEFLEILKNFLDEKKISYNKLFKLFSKSLRKPFCKEEGISSLNNSKKNSDI